jgi:hypothetical protein
MTAGTQTVNDSGNVVQYTNSSTADNDVLVQTNDVSRWDTFMLMSTTGTVDVYVSLDGTNYSTAALSLQDFGATVADPVTEAAAGRVYGFRGKFRRVRVLQKGATNPTACSLICGNLGD